MKFEGISETWVFVSDNLHNRWVDPVIVIGGEADENKKDNDCNDELEISDP